MAVADAHLAKASRIRSHAALHPLYLPLGAFRRSTLESLRGASSSAARAVPNFSRRSVTGGDRAAAAQHLVNTPLAQLIMQDERLLVVL